MHSFVWYKVNFQDARCNDKNTYQTLFNCCSSSTYATLKHLGLRSRGKTVAEEYYINKSQRNYVFYVFTLSCVFSLLWRFQRKVLPLTSGWRRMKHPPELNPVILKMSAALETETSEKTKQATLSKTTNENHYFRSQNCPFSIACHYFQF